MLFRLPSLRRKDSYTAAVDELRTVKKTQGYVVRAKALAKLGDIAKENNNLSDQRVNELATIFLDASNDFEATVRNNAVWGISKFAENNIVPEDLVGMILDMAIRTCDDSDGDIRNSAVFVIQKLAINGKILKEKFSKIFEKVFQRASDSHLSVKANAIVTLASFVEKYYHLLHDIGSTYNMLISNSDDENDKIRGHAVYGLSNLVQTRALDSDRLKEIFHILLSKIDDENMIVKINSIYGLSKYAEYNIIPSEEVFRYAETVLKISCDPNPAIRLNAMHAIQKCIENDHIPQSKMTLTMNVLLSKCNDSNERIRLGAIETLIFLTEKMKISRVVDVINDMVLKLDHETHTKCRASAVKVLGLFGKTKILPQSQLELVIDAIITCTDDVNEQAQDNAMNSLFYILKNVTLSAALVTKILSLSIKKLHDDKPMIQIMTCKLISAIGELRVVDKDLMEDCLICLLALIEENISKFEALEALCRFSPLRNFDGSLPAEKDAVHVIYTYYRTENDSLDENTSKIVADELKDAMTSAINKFSRDNTCGLRGTLQKIMEAKSPIKVTTTTTIENIKCEGMNDAIVRNDTLSTKEIEIVDENTKGTNDKATNLNAEIVRDLGATIIPLIDAVNVFSTKDLEHKIFENDTRPLSENNPEYTNISDDSKCENIHTCNLNQELESQEQLYDSQESGYLHTLQDSDLKSQVISSEVIDMNQDVEIQYDSEQSKEVTQTSEINYYSSVEEPNKNIRLTVHSISSEPHRTTSINPTNDEKSNIIMSLEECCQKYGKFDRSFNPEIIADIEKEKAFDANSIVSSSTETDYLSLYSGCETIDVRLDEEVSPIYYDCSSHFHHTELIRSVKGRDEDISVSFMSRIWIDVQSFVLDRPWILFLLSTLSVLLVFNIFGIIGDDSQEYVL